MYFSDTSCLFRKRYCSFWCPVGDRHIGALCCKCECDRSCSAPGTQKQDIFSFDPDTTFGERHCGPNPVSVMTNNSFFKINSIYRANMFCQVCWLNYFKSFLLQRDCKI